MDSNELAKITKQRNEELAISLGYSSFKEMKASLSKGKLSGGVNSRLEQGGGIVESIGGGIGANIQSIKNSINPKNYGKKVFNELFGGDDFISAYIRGRGKKTGDSPMASKLKPSSPTAETGGEQSGLTASIANDVLTIRNVISSLLRFEKEKKEQSARKGDNAFFKAQDDKEASLESSPTPISANVGSEVAKKVKKGPINFMKEIVAAIKIGLVVAFSKIFGFMRLFKLLAKAFPIAVLAMTLFSGIIAGFNEYKESGNISEAITTGLGAMLDFITFGLFGEDSVKNMFKAVGDFVKPITDKIGSVLTNIKDWIVNNVGIPSIKIPIPEFIRTAARMVKKELPESVTIPAYYPFKDNPKSEEDELTVEKPTPAPVKKVDAMTKAFNKSKEVGIDVDKISPAGLMKVGDMSTSVGKSSNSPTGGLNSMLNSPEMQSVISQLPQSEALDKDVAGVQNFIQGGGINSAMGNLSEGTTGVEGAVGNAMSSIKGAFESGGVTPNPVTPFGAASSGAVVDSGSVEVDFGQRQESIGSGGSVFNSPITTNNSGSVGNNKQPAAPVINFEFADGYTRT